MTTNPDFDHGYYRVESPDGAIDYSCHETLEAAMLEAADIHASQVFVDNFTGVRVVQMGRGDRELLSIWCNGEYTREARARSLDIPYLYPQRPRPVRIPYSLPPDLPQAWVRVRADGPEPGTDGEVENPPRWELEARRVPFTGREDACTFADNLMFRIMVEDTKPGRGWRWTVALVVHHPLARELEDPFLELDTVVWEESVGKFHRLVDRRPQLAWFVLDLSTGCTWLTDYAPRDIERLDRDAVATMKGKEDPQPERCYVWVNLETGEIDSGCTDQSLWEPGDRIGPRGETDSPSVSGPM